MENQTMTVEEVLKVTITNMKRITIPVELSESVGVTLIGCIRNLQLCVNAMEQDRLQKEAAAAEENEETEAEEDERDTDPE